MAIENTLYDTSTLLGVYREMEAPTNYFRSLLVTGVINSDDEYIDFQKITKKRKLAPLVVPTVQGRPIYEEASNLTRLKPAYVKPKDPINGSRVIKRRPGEALQAQNSLSPQQRYQAIVADVLREHRDSIERREEWMVARAAIDGKLTLEGPDYPTVVVDYNRNDDHTVTLTGATWADEDYPILDDINVWIERVRRAKFGGTVNRITLGANVVGPFLRNNQVRDEMDTQRRGTVVNLNTGVRDGAHVQYLGMIGAGVEVYANSDYFELPDGSTENYLDEDTVFLSGPNAEVVQGYGAILDQAANFQALSVFPKMWFSEDPSVTYVMTQSAPLPVIVNPNATLSAKVL